MQAIVEQVREVSVVWRGGVQLLLLRGLKTTFVKIHLSLFTV